jgi:zinc/manganese transport system substrate-binding protein
VKKRAAVLAVFALALGATIMGCHKGNAKTARKTIFVTYSILGSVVKDLAGDSVDVVVGIPNGQDIHEWEPSAKDVEAVNKADLVVQNGLGLEIGIEKTLAAAKSAGVRVFTCSDHVRVRKVGEGEGIPSGDPDQEAGAVDPHLWMDPLAVKSVVAALAPEIQTDLGVDVSRRGKILEAKLDELDSEIRSEVSRIPEDRRRLVTGHESMGYYAGRYGFKLIGAIVPSLSTQAEVSASQMAALKKLIRDNGVGVVFTEAGTPAAVAKALAEEAGVRAVSITTHGLPEEGTYFAFMRDLTRTIVEGLR